jgi:hypothetical protein
MLSFRDQTFCTAECANNAPGRCPRNLGPEDRRATAEWSRKAGFGEGVVAVTMGDFSAQCENYKPPSK